MLTGWTARHALVAALVVAGLVLAVALGFGGSGSKADQADATSSTTSTSAKASTPGSTDAEATAPTTPGDITTQTYFDPDDLAPNERGPDGIRVLQGDRVPVDVDVPSLKGLHDGDTVHLHIAPDKGELVYSVDVRLCMADIQIDADAALSPEQSGKCLLEPFSPASDSVVRQPGMAPYESIDAAFRVGVGTKEWTRFDGTPASLTCGPGHPCSLVVKFQIPYGYGYRVYPVTFAA